ncbi:MAG: hypothetical protein H7Y12_08475, partial [Sphingobacteriaceae bacterium]|nr:hypothetical protein [Cytophagaceae bacterium]
LLTEIYRPLLLTAVVGYLGFRFNRAAFHRLGVTRNGLFFFALGLSASVPLAISAKQGYHYLLPCLPFFGMGMAVFFAPLLLVLTPNRPPGGRSVMGLLVFFTGLCLLLSARTLVDYWRTQPWPYLSDFVYDMHQLSRYVPEGACLTAPESTIRDGELLCYLQRYRRIALVRRTTPAVLLSISDSTQAQRWTALGYRPIEAGLRTCILLQKR